MSRRKFPKRRSTSVLKGVQPTAKDVASPVSEEKPVSSDSAAPSGLPPSPSRPLHVLIVGAGIGGVTMGLMLERAGISYQILEASLTIRLVGSALTVGPNLMRVMDQLGFLEELMRESKPVRQIRYYDRTDGHLTLSNHDGIADMMFCQTRYGNAIRVIPRTTLYNMLYSALPKDKILMGKRVISTTEIPHEGRDGMDTTSHVLCTCKDGTIFEGSILVGADGSYSTVRKHMFLKLEELGELNPDDKGATLQPYQHCVVGVTEPLDPIEFEAINGHFSEFQVLRGRNNQHSIWLMPLTDYRISWSLFCQFPESLRQEYDEHRTRVTNPQSHWKDVSKKISDHAQSLLESLCHVQNPLSNAGGDVGDLVDQTPPDRISYATMEQGVFTRWYHGRTVLLGDACHKSLPYGGQGANQAILDSVYLVNKIFALSNKNPSTREWGTLFEEYQRDRTTSAYLAVLGSSAYDFLFGGQGWLASICRFVYFFLLPWNLFYIVSDAFYGVRPLLRFLPLVKDMSCVPTSKCP